MVLGSTEKAVATQVDAKMVEVTCEKPQIGARGSSTAAWAAYPDSQMGSNAHVNLPTRR